MKIDFNGEKMSVHFDKVPRLLYFNETGEGCGAIFVNGQRMGALISADIKSKTKDSHDFYPVSYRIKTFNKETRTEEVLEHGDLLKQTNVSIKIADIDFFKEFIGTVKLIFDDPRIPEEVKREYEAMLLENSKPDERGSSAPGTGSYQTNTTEVSI